MLRNPLNISRRRNRPIGAMRRVKKGGNRGERVHRDRSHTDGRQCLLETLLASTPARHNATVARGDPARSKPGLTFNKSALA